MISKNTLCWFRTIGKTKITVPDLKPTPYSLSSSVLSLSPQSAISHSLSVFSAWLPTMFHLDWFNIKSTWCSIFIIIVWLTINVWGRTCCFTYTFDTILIHVWASVCKNFMILALSHFNQLSKRYILLSYSFTLTFSFLISICHFWGLYYKNFYGHNCCRIIISWSVFYYHSLLPWSNICRQILD